MCAGTCYSFLGETDLAEWLAFLSDTPPRNWTYNASCVCLRVVFGIFCAYVFVEKRTWAVGLSFFQSFCHRWALFFLVCQVCRCFFVSGWVREMELITFNCLVYFGAVSFFRVCYLWGLSSIVFPSVLCALIHSRARIHWVLIVLVYSPPSKLTRQYTD